MAECDWLNYDSCCVKDLPIFYVNVCDFPSGCGMNSVPRNSGLQGDVLTGDSWGSFPLILSPAVFLPSPSHVWRELWKQPGKQPIFPACSFIWQVQVENFTCNIPWQGIKLNTLFLVSKKIMILWLFPCLSIKGWGFQQIQVLLCREHCVNVFLHEPQILCSHYLGCYWLWGRQQPVAGGCRYHFMAGDIVVACTEFVLPLLWTHSLSI